MTDFSLILSVFRRHKMRTLFTVLSVAVAFAIFIVLTTLFHGFNGLVNFAQAQRIIVWAENGPTMPVNYAAKIATLRHVKAVSYQTGLSGNFRGPNNGVYVKAVSFADFLKVYVENTVTPQERQAMLADRKCTIAGAPAMRKHHWKVGDTIPLTKGPPQNNGSTTWYFRICGVFKTTLPDTLTEDLVGHYAYINEGRADVSAKDRVNAIVAMADDARNVPTVARTIDGAFANADPSVMALPDMMLYASVFKSFGDAGAILAAIGAAVFFSMLLVTGNAMANSVRQRMNEFALMRALGFTRRRLAWLVLWEAILVIGVGAAIGLPLGAQLCAAIAPAVSNILPYFFVTWQNVAAAILLAVLFSFITGILPVRRVNTLAVADTLRRH